MVLPLWRFWQFLMQWKIILGNDTVSMVGTSQRIWKLLSTKTKRQQQKKQNTTMTKTKRETKENKANLSHKCLWKLHSNYQNSKASKMPFSMWSVWNIWIRDYFMLKERSYRSKNWKGKISSPYSKGKKPIGISILRTVYL